MNTKNNNRAVAILKLCEKKLLQIQDCKKRIEIENNKPLTESFLFAPEIFYSDLIKDARWCLKWLANRFQILIEKS